MARETALDPRQRPYQTLQAVCIEYKLSTRVSEHLDGVVEQLAEWKQDVQAMTMTPKARATALEWVKATAKELVAAIEALPFDLRMKLDNQYFGLNSPEEDCIADFIALGLSDPRDLDLGGSLVPAIAAAVERTIAAASLDKAATQRPGRQSTVVGQADFVRCIAHHVKPAGIRPSNAGRFRRVCEAVFEAAGLTLSDRALRHFMSEVRPSVKAAGFCL